MKDTEGTTDLREPMMEKYHDEEKQTNEMFETKEREHLKEKRSRSIASICFYALFSLNVVQFVLLFLCAQNKGSTSSGPFNSQLQSERNVERLGTVYTKYMSPNETESQIAWENIEAGHGMIALTIDDVKAQDLPPSLEHSSLPGKMVYGIEGYHAIHCLKTIRRHYFNLLHHQPFDRPMEHDLHCFDSLRQHIMCTADPTILTTTGHGDVGANQTRMCRDWDALREWATAHTACYKDWEPHVGETRWGHCDGGEDGLPRGGLLE